MTHHDHEKHEHQHHHPQAKAVSGTSWLVWVAVALMLGAMLMYVLSDDESIQPGGSAGEAIDSPPVEAAP